jgi:hypothetical protein
VLRTATSKAKRQQVKRNGNKESGVLRTATVRYVKACQQQVKQVKHASEREHHFYYTTFTAHR